MKRPTKYYKAKRIGKTVDKILEHKERVFRYQLANIEKYRTQQRNAYRLKNGIPLDAPVRACGRKRERDAIVTGSCPVCGRLTE